MNLDDVLGIILYEDGIPHTFGKSKLKYPNYRENTYYHDTAFKEEILPTDWFKSTAYPYNRYSDFTTVSDRMASYGFAIILNVTSMNLLNDSNYFYMIQVPQNMTDNMREFFSNFYPKLKELIETNQAKFCGEIYDEDQNLVGEKSIENLDEFYDKIGVTTKTLSK